MPQIINLAGKTFGIWKVLEKTDQKLEGNGSYLYKCVNTKTGEIALKNGSYLRQFQKRNSVRSTTRGRPRKWIITKVAIAE